MGDVVIRDVSEDDLGALFEHQLDPAANHMAAFTAKDPADRDAFTAKWTRILRDAAITKKTILCDGRVAGNVMCFMAPWSGQRECRTGLDGSSGARASPRRQSHSC